MQTGAPPFAREHHAILQSLEVLRLICDRMEREDYVDSVDLQAVIRFLRDVGQRCLDNTEKLLLRPALARCKATGSEKCLNATVQRHLLVHSLFDKMTEALGSATMNDFCFVSAHYRQLLTDLIFEEDHIVAPMIASLFDDMEGLECIHRFQESEREVSRLAGELMLTMRKLESKYVNPHCI